MMNSTFFNDRDKQIFNVYNRIHLDGQYTKPEHSQKKKVEKSYHSRSETECELVHIGMRGTELQQAFYDQLTPNYNNQATNEK